MASVAPNELTVLDSAPAGLFGLAAHDVHALLPGPTLIHLDGEEPTGLFVSVLLHGNETSGWAAVCRLLAEGTRLRRGMSLFVCNPQAAAAGVRSLEGQSDHNRIWRDHRGPERRFVDQLLREIEQRSFFAAVDLHNNTGHNPHYSVLTNLDKITLDLAGLFSDKAVYVEEPDTVLAKAVEHLCPAFTVEVGPVGDVMSDERAHSLLTTLLELDSIPPLAPDELTLFRAIGRLHVDPAASYRFADEPGDDVLDLVLTAGIEAVNFHALPAGTEFGIVRERETQPLRALDPLHSDITEEFFTLSDDRLVLKKATTPAMYTTDKAVIRQDCLCYFMEQMTIE